ncbi:MAG: DNA polymerase III subunit gamma/tau [Clostridia bacterium]|nr:DNA polymerase III subunit gamma/tau [Clostridia bacterium]
MYQALYRKWRPRTFEDVVGQEHITETLKNQIMSGRLSHAYLFVGTRGTGKTTCAKILAKAVNCEHPENGSPCNRCNSCVGIDDGSIMDVVELDAASNNGVDNVRALRDEAIFSPVSVRKRVYIIDEVHMLSSSAFNALLKILEEPPEHLMFILATTELHKVPATILSRCQRHSFKRIETNLLAKRISYVADKENMRLEPNAAELLARLADGSLRDGLSLLDQCSGEDNITAESVLSAMGLAGNLRIAELLNKISDGDTESALNIFNGLWRDGKAPATLLSELNSLMRDILMLKVAPKGGSELLSGGFDIATLKTHAKRMTPEELICGLDSVSSHLGSLRDGRDPKTTAELCIIGLCEPQLGDSVDNLKKRISKLEAVLENGFLHNVSLDNAVIKEKISDAAPLFHEEELPPFDTEKTNEVSYKDIEDSNRDKSVSYLENDKIATQQIPESKVPVDDMATCGGGLDFAEEPIGTADGEAKENPFETKTTNGAWSDILAELKNSLQPGQYNILSNESMAKGDLEGETLIVFVPSSFVKGQLEQPFVLDCIKNAARKVSGSAIAVKISENKQVLMGAADKLDGLSKFGNFKFE